MEREPRWVRNWTVSGFHLKIIEEVSRDLAYLEGLLGNRHLRSSVQLTHPANSFTTSTLFSIWK